MNGAGVTVFSQGSRVLNVRENFDVTHDYRFLPERSTVAAELSKNCAEIRKKEANGRRIITYCAGCVHYLGRETPTSHLLDLLLQPEATLQGKVKTARSPFTYWNRLKLKWRLKRTLPAAVRRERTYRAEKKRRIRP